MATDITNNITMKEQINNVFNDKKKAISKVIDINKNYNNKIYKNNDGKYMLEFFENDKSVMKTECCMMGMYNVYNSVWYWAWNLDNIDKQLLDNKVQNFSHEIKRKLEDIKKVHDVQYMEQLYYRTSNGNFYISPKNIEGLIKLGLYILDGHWVTSIPIEGDDKIKRVEYYVLTKIL